jgi:hypothetical protein
MYNPGEFDPISISTATLSPLSGSGKPFNHPMLSEMNSFVGHPKKMPHFLD